MLNEVRLIGNLGADPELRTTATGQLVATLRVATSERWQNAQGEWQEATDWHTVVVWGQGAQRAQERCQKGQRVLVQGKLKVRQWDDRQSGQRRTAVEVVADRVQPLDRSQGGEPRQAPRSAERAQPSPSQAALPVPDDGGYFDEDVPF